MKIRTLNLLALLCLSVATFAQERFSADVYTGILFPQTDLPLDTYPGHKPNLAVGAGIGFNFNEAVRIKGDLLYGTLNGNDATRYYEATIFEPKLGLDISLIQLFSDWDKFKINLYGGTGMTFYHSNLYSIANGQRLSESPVRQARSLSPNAFGAYGASLTVPLSHKLELSAGYVQRHLFNTPYLDVVESGEATDHYGALTAGLTFYLKSDRKPGTVEVEEDYHLLLKANSDSLRETQTMLKEKSAQREDLERQITIQRDLISELRQEVDDLKSNPAMTSAPSAGGVVKQPGSANQAQATSQKAAEELRTPRYRLVVASLPSENRANNWVASNRNLDKSNLFVVYAEEVDSYRVVYRSYDSYQAARKEQQSIKADFPDAWIIKF